MKKIWLFILSIFWIWLLSNQCFWYDVIIYGLNDEVLDVYTVEEWITEITLDWNWSKNWNDFTFLDWFNGVEVNYIDSYWENQSFTWVTDLYINWDNTISYTGEQYLSLTDQKCWVFNWYTPVFDVTWSITTIDDDNVFTNFSDNALKVLLSNIPSYIQYITIFLILLFLFWFIRRFKRKR